MQIIPSSEQFQQPEESTVSEPHASQMFGGPGPHISAQTHRSEGLLALSGVCPGAWRKQARTPARVSVVIVVIVRPPLVCEKWSGMVGDCRGIVRG